MRSRADHLSVAAVAKNRPVAGCLPEFSLLGSCAEATGTIVAEQATPRTHTASPAQTGRGKPPGGSEPGIDPRAQRQPPGEGGSGGGDRATLSFSHGLELRDNLVDKSDGHRRARLTRVASPDVASCSSS